MNLEEAKLNVILHSLKILPYHFAIVQWHNKNDRKCRIGKILVKPAPDNVIEVDFRKLTAPVMLERIARDWPDAKAAFVIVWPGDGSMPQYFSNTADNAVVMLRLQQFIHKWYNGDFAHAVDNPENQT